MCLVELSAATTFKVYAKASADAVATSGGFYISSGDASAGNYGYIVVELCYVQQDQAADYNDIEAYLPNKIVSSGS